MKNLTNIENQLKKISAQLENFPISYIVAKIHVRKFATHLNAYNGKLKRYLSIENAHFKLTDTDSHTKRNRDHHANASTNYINASKS